MTPNHIPSECDAFLTLPYTGTDMHSCKTAAFTVQMCDDPCLRFKVRRWDKLTHIYCNAVTCEITHTLLKEHYRGLTRRCLPRLYLLNGTPTVSREIRIPLLLPPLSSCLIKVDHLWMGLGCVEQNYVLSPNLKVTSPFYGTDKIINLLWIISYLSETA